jgi:pimeloyl-ACP methyl ester carboxylesterase
MALLHHPPLPTTTTCREPRAPAGALVLLLVACSRTTPGTPGGPSPDAATPDAAAPDARPTAACIVDPTTGYHEDTCDGLVYDVTTPPQCTSHGACGLIADIHGLTMSGNMEDANTNLRALGVQYGYVVVQPNANPAPPDSMFMPGDDDKIYAFLQAAIPALGIDPGRVHFTGFSDGGEMTFRFTCAHAEMFASVAAAAAVGCFQPGQTPSREIPLLFMNGTKDALVDFQTSAIPQRDAIISTWNFGPGTVVASGTGYQRTRYTSPGGDVFEFLQHDYESNNPILDGHCYPGSTDPGTAQGQLFPFGCVAPNEFTWGVEVIKFFMAHE